MLTSRKDESIELMSKEELMQFLKHCSDLKDEYMSWESREEGLRKRVAELRNPPKVMFKQEKSIIPRVVFLCLSFGTFAFPIFAIGLALIHFFLFKNILFHILSFSSFVERDPVLIHCLFSWLFSSSLFIPYSIEFFKDKKKEDLDRMEKYYEEVRQEPQLMHELQSIPTEKQAVLSNIQQELSKGLLYEEYFPYAKELWQYLYRGRADTLKEAINLLEQELANKKRLEADRKFYQEMLSYAQRQEDILASISDDISHAADATEDAAKEIRRRREGKKR